MPRLLLTRLLLSAAVVAVLPACSFSEGGDFECVNGATVTATVDGRPFRADCVEVYADGTLSIGAFENYEVDGATRTRIGFTVPEASVGTYPLTGAASLDFFTSPPGDGSNDRSGTATTGQIVITTVSDGRVLGTFEFTAPEEMFNGGDPTPTGGTVVGTSGAFTIPL